MAVTRLSSHHALILAAAVSTATPEQAEAIVRDFLHRFPHLRAKVADIVTQLFNAELEK